MLIRVRRERTLRRADLKCRIRGSYMVPQKGIKKHNGKVALTTCFVTISLKSISMIDKRFRLFLCRFGKIRKPYFYP